MSESFLEKLQKADPNASPGQGLYSTALADAVTGFIRDHMRGKSMAQQVFPPIPQGAKTLSGHPVKRVRRSRIWGEKLDYLVLDEVLSNKTLAAAFGFDRDKEAEELAKEIKP